MAYGGMAYGHIPEPAVVRPELKDRLPHDADDESGVSAGRQRGWSWYERDSAKSRSVGRTRPRTARCARARNASRQQTALSPRAAAVRLWKGNPRRPPVRAATASSA